MDKHGYVLRTIQLDLNFACFNCSSYLYKLCFSINFLHSPKSKVDLSPREHPWPLRSNVPPKEGPNSHSILLGAVASSFLKTIKTNAEQRRSRNHKLADLFPGASAILLNSTSLPMVPESPSSNTLSPRSTRSSISLPASRFASLPRLSARQSWTPSLRILQLVTKKMMAFHRPCRGSTEAVATWYWKGDEPESQPWMRFMLLGIHVTSTLRPKRKDVRR